MHVDADDVVANSPVRQFLDKHLALIGAVLLVVIAVLKVLFASRLDMPTALTLLAVVDRTQLITASLLTGLAFAVPLLLAQADSRRWILAGHRPGAPLAVQLRTTLLWVPIVAVALSAYTLPLLIVTVVGIGGTFLIRLATRRVRAKRSQIPPNPKAAIFGSDVNNLLLMLIASLSLLVLLLQPWLAKEAIRLSDGKEVAARYVGTQGEMTLLLETRSVMWVRTDDIGGRELCRDRPEWWTATVTSLLPGDGVLCAPLEQSSNSTVVDR